MTLWASRPGRIASSKRDFKKVLLRRKRTNHARRPTRIFDAAGQLPARLTAEQAAWVLDCQEHDIPALVAAKLLKPLGNPPPNGIKYFATADLLEAGEDRPWLLRMSAHLYQHWQHKNTHQKELAANRETSWPGDRAISTPFPFRRRKGRTAFWPARADKSPETRLWRGAWGRRKSPKNKRRLSPETQPPLFSSGNHWRQAGRLPFVVLKRSAR